ncbi:hypothetical protein N7448_006711 [Penicillium atrosanguineum]|uniref:Uncharacterized protein n=1 Tax=Penicillium atrosanguineum TaxID=1132637 RepID=A0A9W9GYY5_9EURO|nr:sugar phosphate/phosphate translocator [Penicillium atrosanguineum]KAJ5132553.1 hypothetical protein N7448_006711 [Penicillium atrosanguineum]KAJ5137233.1 hypothetical protein N7526_003466 [Penicillium atrosanguineum]KAJ5290219.1 sugar phosphate/phosphate translocator [Penicillium atrosanguineum]KAJ5308043.1 hypothetical protein N7476_008699 [Penicillium atrosanguineum]
MFTPMVFLDISHSGSFQSAEDAVRDPSWQKLLPSGGGFLFVQESDGTVQGYGVSMFHQLHCLSMIRDMLLGQPMSHAHEASDWSQDSMHWLHCLDYLAQGVLCAADDTLEKPGFTKNVEGKLVKGIDGMNHTHQCRDWAQLREVVEHSETVPRKGELLGSMTVFKVPGTDSKGKPWVVSES